MAEDTNKEEEQEEQPEEEEEEEEELAEAELDHDLDIDLEPAEAAPKQAGGCRGVKVIVLVVLLAVFVSCMWYLGEVRKAKAREEAVAAEARRKIQYKAGLASVAKNVLNAVDKAKAGKMEEALALLGAAEDQLTVIAASANEADDQDWAAYAMSKKQTLMDAQAVIAWAYESYQQEVEAQFDRLTSKFRDVDLSGRRAIEEPEVAPEEPQEPEMVPEPQEPGMVPEPQGPEMVPEPQGPEMVPEPQEPEAPAPSDVEPIQPEEIPVPGI